MFTGIASLLVLISTAGMDNGLLLSMYGDAKRGSIATFNQRLPHDAPPRSNTVRGFSEQLLQSIPADYRNLFPPVTGNAGNRAAISLERIEAWDFSRDGIDDVLFSVEFNERDCISFFVIVSRADGYEVFEGSDLFGSETQACLDKTNRPVLVPFVSPTGGFKWVSQSVNGNLTILREFDFSRGSLPLVGELTYRYHGPEEVELIESN